MSNGSRMGGKGGRTFHWSITTCLWEHFKLVSIAVAQSLAVDPSFSDHIWSLEATTINKRVLIPIYEMSAKEIEGYIKCFDVNVQTWGIIIRADQVQGALRSQLLRVSGIIFVDASVTIAQWKRARYLQIWIIRRSPVRFRPKYPSIQINMDLSK